MSKPTLDVDVLPSQGGRVYYLPLAARSANHKERLKIAVRLKIKNDDPAHATLKINGIRFSFPGTNLADRTMALVSESISPKGGSLAFGKTATWSNGTVITADDETIFNQVYLDGPPPPQIRIDIECDGFSEAWSETFDLIPWLDPTGNGPVRMPFSLQDLEDNEYIIMSARHKFNGGANGTQIFAHDIKIQALMDGAWSGTYTGEPATDNSDVRVFGRPVRAMADGEVFEVEDGWADNPVGEELPEDKMGSNNVWVRHGDLEVNYRHLRANSIIVSPGQAVVSGQKLAEAGNSGNTGGSPHLHMQCRVASTDTLCGFAFKKAWMLEQALVPADGSKGPRVELDGHGVCEEVAAIRPFSINLVPVPVGGPDKTADREFAAIVGQVFGGVSKGGGGFVVVGGKVIKIPPRGIKWDLLNMLVELDAVDELGRAAASQRRKEIARGIEKAAAALKKGDDSRHAVPRTVDVGQTRTVTKGAPSRSA